MGLGANQIGKELILWSVNLWGSLRCDSNNYCITAIGLDDMAVVNHSLSLDFNINDKRKIWRFEVNNYDSKNAKPLKGQLILLFAGYSQPTEILYIHQRWLKLITGAEVLVVPSADQSEKFKFGLDYTAAVVAEIKRLKPTKVPEVSPEILHLK